MKNPSTLLLVLSAAAATSQGAISLTAVGVYDAPTNGNVVDTSETTLDVATFSSDVASAFASGTGGVINFDNGSGSNGTWSVAFNGGASSLSVSVNGGQLNMNTNDVAAIKATPISGNSYYRMGFSSTTFDFTSHLITEFGFTLLARSTTRTLNNITVTFSDNSTLVIPGSSSVSLTANTVTSSSDYLTESGSGIDRFFGYKDTSGLGIKQIVVNGGDNLIIDDFGFIASPIPEPSASMAALLGLAGFLTRRRRA